MRGRADDLSGRIFERLTVVSRAESQKRPCGATYARWNCTCECGAEKIVDAGDLRAGDVRSCGCLMKEEVQKRSETHGHARVGKVTRTYNSWVSAKQRCFNPDDQNYGHYGGRGITMCEEWANDFEAFLAYMGERPRGRTLDRINVNGNYEPGNCRWATPLEQSNNQRPKKFIRGKWRAV